MHPRDLPPQGAGQHLLVVELNEFDADYLAAMAARMGLSSLQRALSYRHSKTWTPDRIEHQGLDPWVQWPAIHCGKPSAVHAVRHLGETRVQTAPQIWHALASQGFTWGVWGAMNAPMGDPRGCRFFMPDPWSFEEAAYPRQLNDLLALPRYVAQNYLDIDYRKAIAAALRMARFLAAPGHWALLARFAARASAGAVSAGVNVHTFTTLLDYLSVLFFVKLRRDLRPNFSLIFLNHMAHLQHHFWALGSKPHPQMALGLRLCDAMFELLLGDREDHEAFLLMNAFKQRNVAAAGFYVYRQRNPQKAIEALGVAGGRVEQCMTHDAAILFSDRAAADRAFDALDRCRLSDGRKAFYVERQGPVRIFYQLAIEDRVPDGTMIACGGNSYGFYDLFQLVCERTGAHVPEGDIFYDGMEAPAEMANHQLFQVMLKSFAAPPVSAANLADARM